MKKDLLKIKKIIDESEAILVGIGSGMTNADNISYYGKRFEENFEDFKNKYKFIDMLQASLFDYPDWLTYWAFHSRFILLNYYLQEPSKSFFNLRKILKDKNFFIITTNSDSSLEKTNFHIDKYFYVQGKYNLLQCSKKCSNITYENKNLIEKMVREQKNMQIPLELLPKCTKCDSVLEVNKRHCFMGMVEDEKFVRQQENYSSFIKKNKNKKILYLEIGCGNITPQFIKWKFWEYVEENKNATYLVLNQKQYRTKKEILDQSIFIYDDISVILEKLSDLY
ncbi:SIR2 family NAD-dependent protein deacylase [Mycoplasmopsis cricetuli]|uniref:deacetylase SIR2 n=1 Tax=Mycoplasmopsis cricetuli TaxID=171283 RepID=UPI0004700C2F|nr:deacetylase SIR2 [Mycoplasmopsis cricetuli]